MEWHPFAERFPMLQGDEWEAFKASLKRSKGNRQPIIFRTVKGKKQGLDGRNRSKACEELGLKCREQEEIVDDSEVKEFILDCNLRRRHMTPELRKEIVAELRADGKSTRAIAEAVGVSKDTVRNDLKNSGGDNSPPAGITGTDGKTYPSRAERLGLNAKPTPPKIEPNTEESLVEESKPESREDEIKRINSVIESYCRRLWAMIDEIPEDVWLGDMGRKEGARQKIKDACGTLRTAKCHCVCPICQGSGEGCKPCIGSGRMPKVNYDRSV